MNADSSLNNDILGNNMYTYCSNNPIMRADSSGQAWGHWALASLIVAACAIAVVITAGGITPAIWAVAAVANGVTAATTAATVAAGALIGAGMAFGTSVASAASNSRTAREFAQQGSWGTVAITLSGAVLGGMSSYELSRKSVPSTPSFKSRGSTAQREPENLQEQLALEQVKSNPQGSPIPMNKPMGDSRWPANEGWEKMSQKVETSIGTIDIHYNQNKIMNVFDDFKVK